MKINGETKNLRDIIAYLTADQVLSVTDTKVNVVAREAFPDLESSQAYFRDLLVKHGISECLVTIEAGKIALKDASPFERSLENWIGTFTEQEQIQSAQGVADTIRNAYYHQKKELTIWAEEINSLPSALGELVQLEILQVCDTPLETLPPEIEKLKSLKELYLSDNQIRSLPPQIGGLISLQKLVLNANLLTTLPTQIGSLASLEELSVSDNYLTSLPETIGDLTVLMRLFLNNNELRYLPEGLGFLPLLNYIDVRANQSLDLLPVMYPHTEVMTDATENPLDDILEIEVTFQEALKTWTDMVHAEEIATDFLTDDEQHILHTWLRRLEDSVDFQNQPERVARLVVQMFKDLSAHPDFKRGFISYVEMNNTACEDRTAMALNELYVMWKSKVALKDLPPAEKLRSLEALTRTKLFRDELERQIKAYEASVTTRMMDEFEGRLAKGEVTEEMRPIPYLLEESVEVYLYYEIKFKEQLGLESFSEQMRYSQVGQRDWVDEQKLVSIVQTNTLAKLSELPEIVEMAEADPTFNTPEHPDTEPFEEESDGDYKRRMNKLMHAFNTNKRRAIQEWIEKSLVS